jgi:type I restriction enzyme S subunit
MINDLNSYSAYKNSGVPWLGKVPEHWQVRRGKWLFRHKKEINADRRHTNVLSLTLRGVVNNDPEDPEGLVPKDYGSYQYFAKGDLVFKLIDLENLRTSRVGLIHEGGIMSPAYVRLIQVHDGVQRFFFQQYYDLYQRGIFNQLGAGVRSTLGPTDLLNVPIVVPDIPEQVAIVRFLDHLDRRVRRYIRAKHKLIKLLEEQKQVIIHHAVTRGLDPNFRLKPSGVEWLGDVPEHWEVMPLKRIAWFKSGAGFPVSDQGDQSLEVPFIKVSDMTLPGNELWIESAGSTVSNETAARLGAFVFPADTIIFPKVGGALLTNKRRLLRKPSCIDNNVMGCVIKSLDLQYGFILLQQLDLGRLAKPGPVPAIGEGDVREIKVALPPSKEQTALVESVHQATADLDTAIIAANRETDLLREYRTRLSADVVTGKLNVRDVAARLPEETDELEPLDDVEPPAAGAENGEDANLDAAPEEGEA